MSTDISVIMPCFNCSATLDEAVDSVLAQQFHGSLEIITVDDCSTDETPRILHEKAERDDRVKVLRHAVNRGGGAARNTGVGAARGDVLLVFDSDDVLDSGAVEPMLQLLSSRPDLDGALFEEQRTFRGRDKSRYTPFRYYTETTPIELRAAFQGKKALIGNFMYRRSAFEKTGGYPEHHGFDTQGFCMRFLSKGLRAQVAPGSFFWHRVSGPAASYFDRVFASGRFNLNTYLIYEDMVELFSDQALLTIMKANVFRVSGFGADGLGASLESLERSGVRVLRQDADEEREASAAFFVQGVVALRRGDYSGALHCFTKLAGARVFSPLVLFNIIRCSLGLAGTAPARIIDAALAAVEQLRLRKLPSMRGWSLIDRALVKAARITLSAHGIEDPVS